MKRLLSSCLLGSALAAGALGCSKGGGTSPAAPEPAGPPARWAGTAVFTHLFDTYLPVGTSTQTFNVTVTWVKVENPNPPPPAGGARYVPAHGSVHVSWRQAIDRPRCTMEGDGDYPLTTPNPTASALAQRQTLELGPDGRYQGTLNAVIKMEYLHLCANGPNFTGTTQAEMELDISGQLDGGRMHGAMAPYVLETGVLKSTRLGSWDFTPN